jgi:hypothetical protein
MLIHDNESFNPLIVSSKHQSQCPPKAIPTSLGKRTAKRTCESRELADLEVNKRPTKLPKNKPSDSSQTNTRHNLRGGPRRHFNASARQRNPRTTLKQSATATKARQRDLCLSNHTSESDRRREQCKTDRLRRSYQRNSFSTHSRRL